MCTVIMVESVLNDTMVKISTNILQVYSGRRARTGSYLTRNLFGVSSMYMLYWSIGYIEYLFI